MSIQDINHREEVGPGRGENIKTFTITVLGCRTSGKSSLVRRLVDGGFCPKDVIEDEDLNFLDSFYRADLNVNGEDVLVDILDTGKEYEEFKNRTADGYIIVYSIVDQRSFAEAHQWLKIVGKNSSAILVGSKCDLNNKRIIGKSEGEDLAIQFGVKFMEASAKVRVNEVEIFRECIREIQNPIKDCLKDPDCCTML